MTDDELLSELRNGKEDMSFRELNRTLMRKWFCQGWKRKVDRENKPKYSNVNPCEIRER